MLDLPLKFMVTLVKYHLTPVNRDFCGRHGGILQG